MITTLERPNRYAGPCAYCGVRIAERKGILARTDGGAYTVVHDGPCPTATAPAEPVARPTQDGIYRTEDGTIYKVLIAKRGSGHLYAKRLEATDCTRPGCERRVTLAKLRGDDGAHRHGHFVYAAGMIHQLRAEQRLSEHDARVYGRLYAICVACGADLTDETSIARGIGPICRGKSF
jgi:hypothetical protein